MALSPDLQERLDLLTEEVRAADRDAAVSPDSRLTPLIDLDEYCAPGGPLELELAMLRDRQQRLPPPRLLVMLCGTSPAPLLLSQRFLEPRKVLLVGSRTTQGESGLSAVRAHVPPACLLHPDLTIHDSDPVRAFGELAAGLRPVMDRLGLGVQDVLMDVTGGKKTMTAAAFLVASELGIGTVYMDGELLPNLRLIEPGTARLHSLKDPSRYFWLRERREALNFFDGGNYRMAALLLARMGRDDDARKAEAAALWQDASYEKAVDLLQGHGPVPEALRQLAQDVPRLATLWPGNQSPDVLSDKFRGVADRQGLLRFCADRVAWGLRAYGQAAHQRRAFLDAYSACEALLEVRGNNKDHAKFGIGKPLRLHRNALVHRVVSPEPAWVDDLLKASGRPCLAQEILKQEGLALLGVGHQLLVEKILSDPLAGLGELRPVGLDAL